MEDSALRARLLRRYVYAYGALTEPQSLAADENGAFTLDPPVTGTYLLLDKTLDAYRSEADYLAKQADEPEEAPQISRMLIYLGAAGAALIALIAAVVLLLRLRRRKKKERDAARRKRSVLQ